MIANKTTATPIFPSDFFIKSLKAIKSLFWSNSRIISVQAQNSISSSLSKTLKKQISLEKPILDKKGLLPNIVIIVFQYLILAFILSGTKTKQILFTNISFIFQK